MSSCDFCEYSKNTFFTEHLRVTAFVIYEETEEILGNIYYYRRLFQKLWTFVGLELHHKYVSNSSYFIFQSVNVNLTGIKQLVV